MFYFLTMQTNGYWIMFADRCFTIIHLNDQTNDKDIRFDLKYYFITINERN